MKKSQTLDTILNNQISPYRKVGIGYMGETSYNEDANPKSPEKKVKEKCEKSNLSKRKDKS